MYIVTIDSGTTNTRVKLWENNTVIGQASDVVGVRDTAITGSNDKLSQAVKRGLMTVLAEKEIRCYDNVVIVASGMITSNMGLCEIPHLTAPVSQQQLAAGMVSKILPDIINHPIWFIPGVKNAIDDVNLDNCELMDMMRGEEIEAIGVLSLLSLQGPALIILPGSHSKFVKVNDNNEIIACATTLAGEFIDIITQQTLLANSLNHQFASSIEEEYLLKGAQYCQKVGITRSCFSIRILDLFSQLTINQKANFLLGIVLYCDLQAIKHSEALSCCRHTKMVICGKKILREALLILTKHDDFFTGEIIDFAEENYPPLSGLGAIALVEQSINRGNPL
ncbi:2-dehydro-3-deoxygalactonokinase [Orbus sturtevantii]|uniref:2-dehydro-3-deoxygalactonokinase n=1 Tax=Orbus sturtevantii TaxID=3074109 RepID=UPI00370D087A